ncbi:hypothetical protein RUM43_002998 [Polyplax serrata]|uniref:protein-histidine N-methyltransferase n=1 Tax=Polyplax serrata TaxID=468196 RepID=A0AAN8S9B2_POLSC
MSMTVAQSYSQSDEDGKQWVRKRRKRHVIWAVSTVMTRQNFIPSQENEEVGVNGLIPFWDMCNHTNGYLSTQYKSDKSECLACKSFKKGEQVLMFYGQRSNCDFFVHNGFTYDGNEHDSFRFRLGISKADKLHDERCQLLKSLGVPDSGDFDIYSGAEPVREQLLSFLRIFNMDMDHLNHWKSSSRLSDLMWKDCALDTKVESKVWTFLFNRIKLLLLPYEKIAEVLLSYG